jgi:hypothetical protein
MRKWFVSGVLGAVAASVLAAPLALAATPVPAPAANGGSPGQGLEISPPVVELSADPGQTVTAKIRVRNITNGLLIAKGRADDFGAGNDESGQPKLLLDETGATRFSLKYWVSGVPDLRLAPQEQKTTNVTINVPANAEPGGHFGVVRFTAVPPELEGTGVALSASIGSLILLKVSGQVVEKVSLAEFTTGQTGDGTKDSFKKRSMFEVGPVGLLVRLKNEGTVHQKVQGQIDVVSALGKKVGTVKVNERGGNVLPDSIRRFEEKLDNRKLFGKYTAKLALTYSDGKKIEGSTTFWVIPWKLLLLVLIGLVILVLVGRIGIKRYNDHIIKQARRR